MESLENNNHSSHNQVSNWTKNDNLLYSDITCCNADLHYSTCLVWISCITSSSWTYAVLYITCTGKCTHPPGQHMYCPEFYYPAGHHWLVLHYYSCHAVQYYALSDPVLAGYINKSNLRLLLSLQPAAILKTWTWRTKSQPILGYPMLRK